MKVSDLIFKTKCHEIPAESTATRVENSLFYELPSIYTHSQLYIEQKLPFPTAVQQYNKYIRGSDSNT